MRFLGSLSCLGKSDGLINFSTLGQVKTMKICPMLLNCQSRFKIFKTLNKSFWNLPTAYKMLPKWQNFAKSGHHVSDSKLLPWPGLPSVVDCRVIQNRFAGIVSSQVVSKLSNNSFAGQSWNKICRQIYSEYLSDSMF